MRPRKKKQKKYIHVAKHLVIGAAALFLLIGGAGMLWVASLKIPDLSGINDRQVSQSTKIYDRTGKILLYDVHQDVRRTVVPFDQISPDIKNATIAIEDATFYQHGGIKFSSIIRAFLTDIFTLNFSQGGSTITQQVVKQTILTDEKSIARKLKEWVLAIKLEQVMSKDQILGLYLNESPYGGNIYGVEEAAETYFGKKASDVDLAEAAYLAALPNSPTYYSPYGNHRDALDARKNLVLDKMLENNFITQAQYDKAKAEVVTFLPQSETGIIAPHFVMYVKEYLEQKYGVDTVMNGGLKVITTLDVGMQQNAERIVKKYAESNTVNFNAANAGLVAIDPKTGAILTMVGSRDYFATTTVPANCTAGVNCMFDPKYNVTLALRQPGSTFKPFVYATALEKGYTPDTVVFDVATEFSTDCNPDGTPIPPNTEDKCYMPVDFDGTYKGPITMRDALAQSVNIPAIKFFYLAGMEDSLQTARDMGISTLGTGTTAKYGLTLVLGGGDVTLLDMTSAYSVFANNGVRNPYYAIQTVYDSNGNVLEQHQANPTQVIDKNIALTINDMLSDNVARTPEFGPDSPLYFPGYDVADKTGTTNDYRDAWTIGYTPSIAVGAWAGNNDNSPMAKKIAGYIVAPLWHAFMETVLASSSPSENRFEPPPEQNTSGLKPVMRGFWQGGESYTIDRISGKLATQYTPPETREEKVVTDVHSILYWVNRNDPLGPPPTDPSSDPQFTYWEYAVQQWAAQHNIVDQTSAVIPTATDDVHTPANAPRLTIQGIDPSKTYSADATLSVSTAGQGRYPLAKVDYFLNDQFVGSSSSYPFSISFVPSDITGVSVSNSLKAVGYDSVYNKGQAVSTLRLNFSP